MPVILPKYLEKGSSLPKGWYDTPTMNKTRLESFSDGVFSIVMTVLVLDLKVPQLAGSVSDMTLLNALGLIWPHIAIFIATFTILAVAWINHHFIFHSFAKTVDRWLNLINMFYLMVIVFVPFSASLLGEYYGYRLPLLLFGGNLLGITVLATAMLSYIKRSQDLSHISRRLYNQARFRTFLSIGSYVIGLALIYFSAGASIFFFIFPILFNIIPGTVDLTEKIFRLDFDRL